MSLISFDQKSSVDFIDFQTAWKTAVGADRTIFLRDCNAEEHTQPSLAFSLRL